jgi:hypothetical protein
MNRNEAIEAIVSYLQGRAIPAEALERAWEILRGDGAFVRELRETAGALPDSTEECEAFLSNLAEFSDLSGDEERRAEMPEMAEHRESCSYCRRAFWAIEPPWIAEGEHARLAEPLVVSLDDACCLHDRGLGPAFVPIDSADEEVVAAQMALESRPQWVGDSSLHQCVLEDRETESTITVRVGAVAPGQVGVSCDLSPLDPGETWIEVRQAEEPVPALAQSLADCRVLPIVLGPGAWVIRLRAMKAGRTHTWDLPLEIRQAPPLPGP